MASLARSLALPSDGRRRVTSIPITAITISRSQQKKLALKELIEKVSGQVSSWDKMLNSNTDIPKTKKAFTKLESELKSFSKKLNQL